MGPEPSCRLGGSCGEKGGLAGARGFPVWAFTASRLSLLSLRGPGAPALGADRSQKGQEVPVVVGEARCLAPEALGSVACTK